MFRAHITKDKRQKSKDKRQKTKLKVKAVPVKAAAFPDYKRRFTANGGLRQLLLLSGCVVVMMNPNSP